MTLVFCDSGLLIRFGVWAVLAMLVTFGPGHAASPHGVRVDGSYAACTFLAPCDGGQLGVDRFVRLQPAIDAVGEGGSVWVAAGTYRGPVTITKSLHLQGEAPDAVRLTAITGPVLYITAGTSVTVADLTVAGSQDHGILATSPASLDLHLSEVTLTQNRGAGLSFAAPGRLTLTRVVTTENGTGVQVMAAVNVYDEDGWHTSNADHGFLLHDLAGDVTLRRTRLTANDADADGQGDGLHAASTDGCQTPAIAGTLHLAGVTLQAAAEHGGESLQAHGLFASCIAGDAQVVTDDEGQETTAIGHGRDGVHLARVGGRVMVRGGTYTFNDGAGLRLGSASEILLAHLEASHNAVGVSAEDVEQLAVQGGAFLNNAAEGLDVQRVTSAHFFDSVMAAGNGTYGARFTHGTSFEDSDGVFVDNGQAGIYLDGIRAYIAMHGTIVNTGTGALGEGLELGQVGSVVLDDVTTPEQMPILPPPVAQSFSLPSGPIGS